VDKIRYKEEDQHSSATSEFIKQPYLSGVREIAASCGLRVERKINGQWNIATPMFGEKLEGISEGSGCLQML
jgi:hypothetical protein